jgi:YesN/AraC family two-component response regulator
VNRILFVDDEPNVLAGLKRMLYSLRNEWDMTFVSSGAEALQCLSESPFDVLVTDVRMPGMNGVELLEQVVNLHPGVIRIVLSFRGQPTLS